MRLFFLTLLILMSCSQDNRLDSRLNISFNTQPNTQDPRMAADFVSSTLVCMIYEGLTRCLPGGGVEPALAERVEITHKGKRYRFQLRKAYWSNGEQITAFDFERSWKEIIQPAHSCAFLFYPIKNAEKASRGELSIDEVGIRAEGPLTLCIDLENPTPYFYSLTAFPSFLAAPKNQNVYSGPFQIEKMIHNSEIVLKKNSSYWNQKNVHLDSVHISIIPDEMTALQMFERGELDWIGGSLSPLPPDAMGKLQTKLQYIPSAGSTLCTFNTNQFPFSNGNLRKAFSLAIDRKMIVEKITHGHQMPAQSILPPSFSKQSFDLFDPEKAVFFLDKGIRELGIKRRDLETLTLYFRSNQIEKRLAQILQQEWQNILGIKIQLAQLDYKTHAQRLQSKNYKMALASWIAQFEDPVSLLDRFRHADHLKNYPGWESDPFFAYLTEAVNSKKRDELLQMAENVLANELPLTPIYHWSSPVIVNPRIRKIATSPCGGILFERFELAKK